MNNTEVLISEVNSLLTHDHLNHNYNFTWNSANTPKPIDNNNYEYLRQDAPIYCISSLGVMLNFYKNNIDFKKEVVYGVEFLLNSDFPKNDYSFLISWIIYRTKKEITDENSDKLDLQNVAWWMGKTTYFVSIVSNNFKAQYEKLFIEAWKQYFTNETIESF